MKLMSAVTLLFVLTACTHVHKNTQQVVDAAKATKSTAQFNTEEKAAYQLAGTTTFILNSKETGGTYNIAVSFPDSYASADKNKTYPVIYVLDGQWQFPMVNAIAGSINMDGDMPEALVVGISWQETNGNLMELRERDLPHAAVEHIPHSGKAEKFQNFLRSELFPYIEKNYKAGAHRTITGGSFSALFVTYTLLSQPELFDGYIATSPSLWWDNDSINEVLKKFPTKPLEMKKRFYLSWGSLESADFIRRFGESLKNRNIPNLDIIYAPIENSGHSALNAESYTKGLQFVFQKPDLLLPQTTLQALAGHYRSNDAMDDLHFTVKNGRLHIIFSHSAMFTVKAASSNEFYIQGNGMTFFFDPKNHALRFNSRGTLYDFTRI